MIVNLEPCSEEVIKKFQPGEVEMFTQNTHFENMNVLFEANIPFHLVVAVKVKGDKRMEQQYSFYNGCQLLNYFDIKEENKKIDPLKRKSIESIHYIFIKVFNLSEKDQKLFKEKTYHQGNTSPATLHCENLLKPYESTRDALRIALDLVNPKYKVGDIRALAICKVHEALAAAKEAFSVDEHAMLWYYAAEKHLFPACPTPISSPQRSDTPVLKSPTVRKALDYSIGSDPD